MSEINPTPLADDLAIENEDAPAIDNTEEQTPSGEPSPTPPENAPKNQKEASPSGQFSAKAKRIIALLFVSNILFGLSAFFIWQSSSTRIAGLNNVINSLSEEDPWEEKEAPVRAADVVGNFTNEMKIPYTAYIEEMESKEERNGDHPGSPYFYNFDFYNAENTDTLTILPHFRTIQQAKNFSCGIASIQMVLDYFGRMEEGDKIWDEEALLELVPEHLNEDGNLQHYGYCLEQLIDVLNQIGGFELETTYDHLSDNYWDVEPKLFQNYIKEGIPVIVGDIDRGGHWKVVIGYDDMGTPLYSYDDVLIFADSNDTTDHNADGYKVENAQEFFASFAFYTMNILSEDHLWQKCFIAVKPIEG